MEAITASRAVTFAKEIVLNSIVLDGDLAAIIDSLKNEEVKDVVVPLLFVVFSY